MVRLDNPLSTPPTAVASSQRSRTHDATRTFSHDIKNRLSAVLGYVRMLREERLDGRDTAQALDVIEGNAHEAVTLAVNFLHAAELREGSLPLCKAPASLNQIVEQVIEDEAPRARLGRIDVRADLDPRVPSVSLDAAMIAGAVTNVLNDAIRRSPEGAIVWIETRRFADLVILRVRDQRLGTAHEEDLDLVGGLVLVREIVEGHGGSVSAMLAPEGGHTCGITLPCFLEIGGVGVP